MRRRLNRPEQLHLELQWQYLNWLSQSGEKDDFYETISLTLMGERIKLTANSPFWREKKIYTVH